MTYRVFMAFDIEADSEKEARKLARERANVPVQDVQVLEYPNQEESK